MPTQPALRVLLSHKGKSFKLESVTRIEKIVRPSDSLRDDRGEAGSWVIVQNSDGKPLFRRVIQNPLGTREVFTGEEREMRQVQIPDPSGVVSLLLPDLPEARTVVLYASELDEEKRYRSAEPVFEVSAKQLSAVASEGRSGHGRK